MESVNDKPAPNLLKRYLVTLVNIIYSFFIHIWENKKKYFILILGIVIAYVLLIYDELVSTEITEEKKKEKEKDELERIKQERNTGNLPEYTLPNGNLKVARNPGQTIAAISNSTFNTMIKPHSEALSNLQNVTGNINKDIQSTRNMFYYLRNAARKSYMDAQNKLLNIYTRLVWLFKKIIKIFSDLFRTVEHLFMALLDALYILGSTWNGIIGGAARFFCFDEFTILENGKYIKDIKVGDVLSEKCIVKSVMKFSTYNNKMYNYKGVIVSESHELYENGKWMRVGDSIHGIPIEYKKPFIYCLETSNGEILINNIRFKDFYETTDRYFLNNYYTIFRDYLNTKKINYENIKTLNEKYYTCGFHSKTLIKCWDGIKQINKVKIGDTIFGSRVIGLFKSKNEEIDMYKYKNLLCSGNNIVYHNNSYKLVKNVGKKISKSKNPIYHIMTDDNRLMINSVEYRDFNIILDDKIVDLTDYYLTSYNNLIKVNT